MPGAVGRALDVGAAAAAGYGQILFCESPLGGFFLFLGLAVLAPAAALAGALGGVLATLLARARGYPVAAWRLGLYGYAGVLVGLFWGALFVPGPMSAVVLVAAALLSAPLTRLAHRLLTPREVPTLALPVLALSWLAAPFLERAPSLSPLALETQLLGWALMLAGLAVHSRLLALAVLLGTGVGLGAGGVLAGRVEPGLLGNSVPTAVALGAVLLPWSAGSLLVATVGAAVAGALWWGTAPILEAWGLPALVGPFNLVTVGVVSALRLPAVRRWVPGRVAPLPLAGVGRPEAGRAGLVARRRLVELVRRARSLSVLTGAGVSTAAGLPDYRGAFGRWTESPRITLEDFLHSPAAREAYWREEEKFYRLVRGASPTAVHRALAALYRRGRLSAVITQNVDGLHQAAGLPPEAVVELHGSIMEGRCVDCGRPVGRERISAGLAAGAATPYCEECQGLLKGGSVLFGEEVEPARLDAALRALLASDLLLVLGTSLVVAPASDLLRWAREAGIPVAIVNATATPYDGHAAVTVTADVGAVMLDLLDSVAPRASSQTSARPSRAGTSSGAPHP